MDAKLTAVIEKIQKLRSLASSSNANEAATAAALANRYIDQFRLSEIDLATDTISDPMVEDNDPIYETGKVNPYKASLVNVLAKHYGVAHYINMTYPSGRKVRSYKLVGRTSDIQIVRYMYAWLVLECQRLSDCEAKGLKLGRVYVASYQSGFVEGIREQLEASRIEAKKEATSAAIVKLDNRLAESDVWMNAKHNNIKNLKHRSYRHINRAAAEAGRSQGRNIHLGAALGNGNTKLLGR